MFAACSWCRFWGPFCTHLLALQVGLVSSVLHYKVGACFERACRTKSTGVACSSQLVPEPLGTFSGSQCRFHLCWYKYHSKWDLYLMLLQLIIHSCANRHHEGLLQLHLERCLKHAACNMARLHMERGTRTMGVEFFFGWMQQLLHWSSRSGAE